MKEIDKDKLEWTIFCVVLWVGMETPLVYALLVMFGVLPAPQ